MTKIKNAETTVTATPATPATPEAHSVSKDALKAAFATYAELDEEVNDLKAALDAKIRERSEAVKLVHDVAGSKGPFTFKGQTLKVVSRGDTWFFRGPKTEGSIEID